LKEIVVRILGSPGIVVTVCLVLAVVPGVAIAQSRNLTSGEQEAVDTALAIVRGCQLPDGAITQMNMGMAPETAVWIPPYFSHYAALALLANHHRDPQAGDLARVASWLDWCSTHQEPEGFWHDYEGTRASYSNTGFIDAWDSSAAMYLLVLGRYQAEGGIVTEEMETAALRSLDCLAGLTDPQDGLTVAKPSYQVKYLMDNIEVYAGLVSGASCFEGLGRQTEASDAASQAALMKTSLANYYKPLSGLFAWAQHPNGQQEVGITTLYPDGLAQLFGVAFVSREPSAWEAATNAFGPESIPGGTGTERFAIAASRIGGEDELTWRAALVTDVATFTPTNVYVYRAGLAALALLEGADWMPGTAVSLPPTVPTTPDPGEPTAPNPYYEAYAYYTGLRDQSSGADYFYWQALAGYAAGMAVGDEGAALYNLYTSLGDYYYVAHAVSSPAYARYYYYYYRGLGVYYYYEKRGDLASAQVAFSNYVALANGSF
jgi:hypothetical protein